MTKKLVDIGPAMKEIRDISPNKERRLDPAELAAALGAELVPGATVSAGSPLSKLAERQEIARRIQAVGNAERADAIAVSKQEWAQIKSIAAAVSDPTCTPSAGQVAHVLLKMALHSVLADLATETATRTKEQLRKQLVESDSQP
jgi:hypothetical protein